MLSTVVLFVLVCVLNGVLGASMSETDSVDTRMTIHGFVMYLLGIAITIVYIDSGLSF